MENFTKLMKDVEERKFLVTNGGKGEQVQQTQRNALKQEILAALFADLKEAYPYIYHSDGDRTTGVLIEIANPTIANQVTNEEGSGAITVSLDVKILGLENNAELAEEMYQENLVIAEREKREKEAKKAAKIARDEAERKRKKAEVDKRKATFFEAKKAREEELEKGTEG
jgi:hypothetical protein